MVSNLPKKRKNLEKRVTFRLDQRRLELLEGYADCEGCSVSFIIRHLVNRFVDKEVEKGFFFRKGVLNDYIQR